MNRPLRNFFLFFLALPIFSLAQFTDNFSDGDFTNNPTWSGNDTSFVVVNDSLQSNGAQASSAIYLSTATTLIDSAEWNFLVRLNFNPSSTNYVKIYLVSDQANLNGSLNGYFVQFGEAGTAPDSLDIFVQNGTTATKIFTGISGIMSNANVNTVRVKVIRHTGGTWDVFADKTGGTNFNAEGSFSDNSITATSYFGVVCKYSTASRYNLYYFDDFVVSTIIVDTIKPRVDTISVLSNTSIDVKFSERAEINSAQTLANYSLDNGIGNPVSAARDSSDLSLVHLAFANAFAGSTNYHLHISGVNDFSGNTMNDTSFSFMLPDAAQPNDIVINEILFNPKSGGYDFVELYNRSNKTIDISQLDILEKDIDAPDSVLEQASVASQTYLLAPQNFVVLSANIANIQQYYYVENPNALLQVSHFPNYDDDQSICVLKIHNGETIDSLAYDHHWHFPLLDVEDGVSLERVDYNQPTQDKNNWHSAASTVGFATPTYRNSQFSETGITDDAIKISPEVFTPDNDGDKDFATVNYHFSEPGYVMNARVYDALGREIRNLVSNALLASEGNFQWDGLDDNTQKARVGIYILYIEVFNLQGKVKKFKKEVTLGAKLN